MVHHNSTLGLSINRSAKSRSSGRRISRNMKRSTLKSITPNTNIRKPSPSSIPRMSHVYAVKSRRGVPSRSPARLHIPRLLPLTVCSFSLTCPHLMRSSLSLWIAPHSFPRASPSSSPSSFSSGGVAAASTASLMGGSPNRRCSSFRRIKALP